MRKKLEGNGLWESSRMILPEHRDRQIQGKENDNYKSEKPELEEEEVHRIMTCVQNSLLCAESIKVKLYDRYEDLYVEGVVEKIDPIAGWFQVNGDRFKLSEIIGISDVG